MCSSPWYFQGKFTQFTVIFRGKYFAVHRDILRTNLYSLRAKFRTWPWYFEGKFLQFAWYLEGKFSQLTRILCGQNFAVHQDILGPNFAVHQFFCVWMNGSAQTCGLEQWISEIPDFTTKFKNHIKLCNCHNFNFTSFFEYIAS